MLEARSTETGEVLWALNDLDLFFNVTVREVSVGVVGLVGVMGVVGVVAAVVVNVGWVARVWQSTMLRGCPSHPYFGVDDCEAGSPV